MYYPYFRGKQYELITIRELAPPLKAANFCPIIEPVKETLTGLEKALNAVVEVGGRAIVIVNPYHGGLSGSGQTLSSLLKEKFLDFPGLSAGILLKQDTTSGEALQCYSAHLNHNPVLVHAGFADANTLVEGLGAITKNQLHVFFERYCGKLYQKHYKAASRVLLRDGFQKKKNREYEPYEPYSDLHATFPEEGMDGFGDFLTVGDEYSETGGPAYAIAIHLTFIDPAQDNSMFVYHFVSDRQDTPKDPAGKFAEALRKMIRVLDKPDCKVLQTNAVREFRDLHNQGHFPGLGYVKKLSMSHHIETLADYFSVVAPST